ncbi:MAG TPA: VOC family protein [Chthoniobacterales bacterium]|jgi:predicted lactoylglutathione lyase
MNTTFQSIYPRLPVADLKASLAFYQKLLDLHSEDIMQSEGFAIIHKDKIGIQLVTQSQAQPSSPNTVWIDVAEVEALYEVVMDSVSVEWGPEVYAYGRREFCVSDPDKHQIIFSEITTDPITCGG